MNERLAAGLTRHRLLLAVFSLALVFDFALLPGLLMRLDRKRKGT